jgi:tetratricopeptide (TPR) repeat protein
MNRGWIPATLALVLIVAGCGTGAEPADDSATSRQTAQASSVEPAAEPAVESPTVVGSPAVAGSPAPPADPVAPPAESYVREAPVSGPEAIPEVDLARFQAEVDRNPDNPDAHRSLAISLFKAGRRDEAIGHFEKAAELSGSVDALMDLADAYGFASRLVDAEATYRRVLEKDPDHVSAITNLANVTFMGGKMDESLALYDRAIELDPTYLTAYYHKAVALKTMKRFKEAYQSFGRVMDLEPTNTEELAAFDNSLYEMASLDIAMGAHERAEEMLKLLLEANPEHPKAHYQYAQLLLRQGRVAEAQAHIEKHMEINAKLKPTGVVATGN